MSGYGKDKAEISAGAYPFTKDENEELKQQLKYMGGCEYDFIIYSIRSVLVI